MVVSFLTPTWRRGALAYDPQEDRLYVQPQTFTGFDDSEVVSSQVGVFDPSISEPLEWQTLGDRSFSAGGMAIASRERTYFGMGTRLYEYDARAGSFQNWWDLLGVVQSIEGLALDRTTHTMLVLDGASNELVELRVDGVQ